MIHHFYRKITNPATAMHVARPRSRPSHATQRPFRTHYRTYPGAARAASLPVRNVALPEHVRPARTCSGKATLDWRRRRCPCGMWRPPWPWMVHSPRGYDCQCWKAAERLAWETMHALHDPHHGLRGRRMCVRKFGPVCVRNSGPLLS